MAKMRVPDWYKKRTNTTTTKKNKTSNTMNSGGWPQALQTAPPSRPPWIMTLPASLIELAGLLAAEVSTFEQNIMPPNETIFNIWCAHPNDTKKNWSTEDIHMKWPRTKSKILFPFLLLFPFFLKKRESKLSFNGTPNSHIRRPLAIITTNKLYVLHQNSTHEYFVGGNNPSRAIQPS